MTPTQRRYLEHAVRCEGGEFRWSVRSGGAEGAMHRMVKMLVAAGLVAFDPQQMAWIVTRAGRAAVKEGPPGASQTGGHRNRPRIKAFRTNSGSLAIFARNPPRLVRAPTLCG